MSTAECCEGALSPALSKPQPGEETTLGGVPAFVVRGSEGARASVALVILTDIFGYQAGQARANAARMAAAGGGKLDVLIPDICAGDACAHDFNFAGLPAWFSKHGDDETMPLVRAALRGAREAGYAKVVTVGYCWGARASLLAGRSENVDGFAIAHPSRCAVPDFAGVAKPALFILAETDNAFSQADADAAVAGLRASGVRVVVNGPHAGTVHGFAARGDETVPAVAAARQSGIAAAVDFALSV